MKPHLALKARVDDLHPTRLFLFINIVTAILVVLSSGAVSLHYPIHSSFKAILIGTLVGSLILTIPFRRVIFGWRTLVVAIVGAGSILYLVWPAIYLRAVPSIISEASNYVAFAQYLTRYPEGTQGGLAPIDEYAAGLSGTRFASPAALGVIACFFKSDPGLALVPFCSLLLANIFAGFATLARLFRCSGAMSIVVGAFGVLAGWVPNMFYVGSLDNLLFVALLPFVLVRSRLIVLEGTEVRSILSLAICGAAAFYSYPEGVAIAGIMFAPVLLRLGWVAFRRNPLFTRLGLAVLVTVLLTLPYVQTSVRFLFRQIAVSNDSVVGSTIFPGLESAAFLPAAFALGEEFQGVPLKWPDVLLSVALSLLVLAGILRSRRHNEGLVLTFFVLLGLSVWQAVSKHYSYGFYKVLTIGSVLIIPAVFAGIEGACSRCDLRFRRTAPVIFACLLLGLTSWAVSSNFDSTPKKFHVPLKPYSDLGNLGVVTHNETIRLMLDSDLDQRWALIYLRDQPIERPLERGVEVLPNVRLGMSRARKNSSPAKFLLLNRKMRGAVWTNSKFWLVPISDQVAAVVATDKPNGVEEVNGSAFVWLSDKASSFVIDSPKDGPALIWARKTWIGPSRPEDPNRTVVLRTVNGLTEHKVADAFYALVSLQKGLNYLDMWCAEKPTLKTLPNGDTRALMLGLEDYQARPISGNVDIADIIHSPNDVESYHGMPLLWLSGIPTAFLISSPSGKNGFLRADKMLLGPSASRLAEITIVVKSENSESRWQIRDCFSIPLSLKPGPNRVEVWCDNHSPVHPPKDGDKREQMLGLVNYRITEADR
jgi:hypothetical protein